MDSKSKDWCPHQRDSRTQKKDDPVAGGGREAETREIHVQAKKGQGLAPDARRQAWNILSQSLAGKPCRHLDFRLVASGTVTEYISVVNHPVCDSPQQP